MIPAGRIDEPEPRARGAAIGTAWRERIAAAWDGYERLFAIAAAAPGLQREVAERSLDQTRSWAPALAEEVAGLAGGAGLEPWCVAALNARTEILAAAGATTVGECSTFVLAPPGGGPPRTIQTWDWYEALRDNMLLLSVATDRALCQQSDREFFGVAGETLDARCPHRPVIRPGWPYRHRPSHEARRGEEIAGAVARRMAFAAHRHPLDKVASMLDAAAWHRGRRPRSCRALLRGKLAEAREADAVTGLQGLLDGIEERVDRGSGVALRELGLVCHLVDELTLRHLSSTPL